MAERSTLQRRLHKSHVTATVCEIASSCQHKMRRANTAKDKPETTMTLFFIAGIAALFLATGTVHAAEIPKQYRGAWCETKWQTIYKRCPSADFEVKRTYWTTVESTCTPSAVRKSRYGGHRLLAICEGDEGSRDMPNRVEVRWWLGTNNTRLQVIVKDLEDE